jgi:N-methylhydantoinase A/oxoprolinase/acetone carboxylase beta subunit
MQIGIDVGGTNTDAVLVERCRVLHEVKTATTADVTTGVRRALELLLEASGAERRRIDAVMIGTTHFLNAVMERRRLSPIAALRISLPAAAQVKPYADWPVDLRGLIEDATYMVRGGHEVDGRPIVPLDEDAIRKAAREIAAKGLGAVAVTAAFSPVNASAEEAARAIFAEAAPAVAVTCSHELGRIGLLARENVTLMNAALIGLAETTIAGFAGALAESGLAAPLYITQNDGTVAQAEAAVRFPVLCFSSGTTNSIRGGAFLSGLQDAVVIDVGGTTTDVGTLVRGFPREANNIIHVGGVRSMFRMPDVTTIALGGGSIVDPADPAKVGPQSVGHRLTEEARIFGGATLTLSDIAVAAGLLELGDPVRVAGLDPAFVGAALATAHGRIVDAVDRMLPGAEPVPLIAVGGGAFLVPGALPGISEVVRVPHAGVANAIGAAIAQVSGEVDRIYQDLPREAALAEARRGAEARAVEAGADPATLAVVDMEDIPMAYMPGNTLRVRLRVVGDLRRAD